MEELIKIAKALSDKNRVRILKMLESKPMCVCEITSVLDIANSTVSSHLSFLKDAGLITDKKDGKWVEYQVKNVNVNHIAKKFLEILPTVLNNDELITADKIKADKADREIITSSTILKNLMK